jgi:hypothetical protein
LADNYNKANGLKIETKKSNISYDSIWIAGVEYEVDNDDEYYDKKTVEKESGDNESESI